VKRIGTQRLALGVAFVVLLLAVGGSAYARASSNGKSPAVKVRVHAKAKLAAVRHTATPAKPTVEPAAFTG